MYSNIFEFNLDFESLPDLYENCKYPAYIEYVKLRKVFFDCDFAVHFNLNNAK